jgi:hypothetical protein
LSEVRRERESREAPLEEIVTRRGTGFGKVESKADWESKKSREPKYDEEARTADIQGERSGIAGTAAAAAPPPLVQRTIN